MLLLLTLPILHLIISTTHAHSPLHKHDAASRAQYSKCSRLSPYPPGSSFTMTTPPFSSHLTGRSWMRGANYSSIDLEYMIGDVLQDGEQLDSKTEASIRGDHHDDEPSATTTTLQPHCRQWVRTTDSWYLLMIAVCLKRGMVFSTCGRYSIPQTCGWRGMWETERVEEKELCPPSKEDVPVIGECVCRPGYYQLYDSYSGEKGECVPVAECKDQFLRRFALLDYPPPASVQNKINLTFHVTSWNRSFELQLENTSAGDSRGTDRLNGSELIGWPVHHAFHGTYEDPSTGELLMFERISQSSLALQEALQYSPDAHTVLYRFEDRVIEEGHPAAVVDKEIGYVSGPGGERVWRRILENQKKQLPN